MLGNMANFFSESGCSYFIHTPLQLFDFVHKLVLITGPEDASSMHKRLIAYQNFSTNLILHFRTLSNSDSTLDLDERHSTHTLHIIYI